MAKRNPTAEMADRALQRLQQLRSENSEYPIELEKLLSALTSDAAARAAIAKNTRFKGATVRSHATRLDAPVVLRGDEDRLATSQQLFDYTCRSCPSGGPPWNAVELAKLVPAALRTSFQDALRRRGASSGLLIAFSNEVWIAQRLVVALQRHFDVPEARPIRLAVLAQRAGLLLERDQAKLKKAAATPYFMQHVLAVTDKSLDTLVTIKERAEDLLQSPDTLPMLLAAAQTEKKRLVPISDVMKKASPAIRPLLSEFLTRQLPDGELPGNVAAIKEGTSFKLFLLENLLPSSLRSRLLRSPADGCGAPVAHLRPKPRDDDFATKFAEAFRRLDAQHGSYNQVSLRQLRDALSEWNREQFDMELHKLRLAGAFYLSGVQDRGGISPEDQVAGIREAGLLRVYVSRKH